MQLRKTLHPLSDMKASLPISIRQKIGLSLYRLLHTIRMAVAKKNISLQKKCLLLLNFEIRKLDSTLLQLGENVEQDDIVEFVERHLTERPHLDNSANVAHKNSDLVARLLDECKQSENVKSALAIYFASKAHIFSLANSDSEQGVYFAKAKEYDPTINLFSNEDVFKNHKAISHRLKLLREEISERSAVKFTVTISHVTGILTISSALMLVAGLLYTNTLLSSIGIKASLFFSIGDYIATSVEQLQSVAFSVTAAIAFYFHGIRDRSLRSKMELDIAAKNKRPLYVVALLVLAATITQIVTAWNGRYETGTLTFLACLVSYRFAAQISRNYLKNSLEGEIFLVCLLIFTSYTAIRCIGEMRDLKNGNWGEREETRIITKKESGIDASNLIVIRANSSYIFTVDKQSGNPRVIPKDQVSEIKIIRF